MSVGARARVASLVGALVLLGTGLGTRPPLRVAPEPGAIDLVARFHQARLSTRGPDGAPPGPRAYLAPDPEPGGRGQVLTAPLGSRVGYGVLVPSRGILEFQVAATPGTPAPIEARVYAAYDGRQEVLASAVLPPPTPGAVNWRRESVHLGHLAKRPVRLIFEARATRPAVAGGGLAWRAPAIILDPEAAPDPAAIAGIVEACRAEVATLPPRPMRRDEPIRAVHYFQPYGGFTRFWSDLDLGQAAADFAQIRRDGFNAIILMIPWGGFERRVDPVQFDDQAFERLDRLFELADRHGLGVILRVGSHEVIPEGAVGHDFAPAGVLTTSRDFAGYLALLEEVARRTATRPNLRALYWTWEDVYAIPKHVFRTTEATRRAFVDWLRRRQPLPYWNSRWRERNRTWDEVTIPDYHLTRTEKIRDYFRFHDQELIAGRAIPCFLAAIRRGNPGAIVGAQPRIDADHEYTHEETFRLPPGYGFVASWFGPYQAIVEGFQGPGLPVPGAMTTLRALLARVRRYAGKPVFFDQVFFRQFHVHPALPRLSEADEGPFMGEALGELCGAPDVVGYGLWAWRDYVLNELPNPGFEEGLRRWTFSGVPVLSRDAARGEWALEIDPANHLLVTRPLGIGPEQTLGFFAKGVDARRLEVEVRWQNLVGSPVGWAQRFAVDLGPDYRLTRLVLKRPPRADALVFRLRSLLGRARVDELQFSEETDTTGLYSLEGEARPMRDVMARLNRTVCGAPPAAARTPGGRRG